MVPTSPWAILWGERSSLVIQHYFILSFKTSSNTNPILNVSWIKRRLKKNPNKIKPNQDPFDLKKLSYNHSFTDKVCFAEQKGTNTPKHSPCERNKFEKSHQTTQNSHRSTLTKKASIFPRINTSKFQEGRPSPPGHLTGSSHTLVFPRQENTHEAPSIPRFPLAYPYFEREKTKLTLFQELRAKFGNSACFLNLRHR